MSTIDRPLPWADFVTGIYVGVDGRQHILYDDDFDYEAELDANAEATREEYGLTDDELADMAELGLTAPYDD